MARIEIRDAYVAEAFDYMDMWDHESVKRLLKEVEKINVENRDVKTLEKIVEILEKVYEDARHNVRETSQSLNKVIETCLSKRHKIDKIECLIEALGDVACRTLGVLWVGDYIVLEMLEKYVERKIETEGIESIEADEYVKKILEIGKKYQEKYHEIGRQAAEITAKLQAKILEILTPEEIKITEEDGYTHKFYMRIKKWLKNVVKGVPASPGTVVGTIGDEIIIDEYLTIEDMPRILKAKGLVIEEGGVLTHGAIVAREYKIPCIVLARGATEKLKSGKKAYLNANEGYVALIED